ncbi:MAG TPA: hypothetical protein VF453_06465 [Burkholderiaceae bacterium]
MTVRIAPFTFDFEASQIAVDAGVTSVDVTALYRAAQQAQQSAEGMLYGPLVSGSGLVPLGSGVYVGITVKLLGNWQLLFTAGAYQARVSGGNLVGGPGDDPLAYSPGVQVMLVQSANATVVDVGGSITDDVAAIRALAEADEVYDHEAGLLHTYARGTTTDLIPPKAVTGTTQPTDSGLVQA